MTVADVVHGVVLLVALLALIKIAVPPLAVSLGLMPLRIRADESPGRAEPRLDDADHRRRFEQFVELGFHPVGTTQEDCWFVSPFDWHKRFPASWMRAPDGRTLASFHRLTDEEPIRFGVVTVLEGGALVRTTCPGTDGQMPVHGDYHRVDLRGVEPAELLARHRERVAAISEGPGRAVVSATLREAASVEERLEGEIVRRIDHSSSSRIVQVSFGVPALVTLAVQGIAGHGSLGLSNAAFAICVGAAVSEWTVRSIVRPAFRKTVLESHERPPGPDPISGGDVPPGAGRAG